MPQILILRVVGLAVYFQRNVVRFRVFDFFLTGFDVPLTPRSDDRHIGRKSLDRKLETNLIVSFAGAAMGNGVRLFLLRDFHNLLCDNRPRKGGSQQIFVLINCAGLHGGDDIVVYELLFHIQNIQFRSAGLDCLFL